MSGIVISNAGSLPRDVDVSVTISKPQIEATTDFSVLCFVTDEGDFFSPGPSRIRYYNSLAAVQADFAASSQSVRAATDFFAQSPRAKTMAIAKVFTSAQAGYVIGSALEDTDLDTWKAITTGSFKISIDGTEASVTSVSFASITNLAGIASTLQTKIRAAGSGTGFTAAVVSLEQDGNSYRIKITSGSTGAASKVSRTSAAASGTYIGAMLGLESGDSMTFDGYTPGDLASELELIKDAAIQSGKFVYGWALDKKYRDTSNNASALAAAAWAEQQDAAILGIVTNSPNAYSSSSTSDVGTAVKAAGYRRTFVVYHDNAYYYPEIAILAYALHVNYAGLDTTITTKFKDLFGIPTVPMTVSMLEVLNNKRINTFTMVGNTSRTFREGVESNEAWFMDDLINLDNFREYLQVAVYNVFLQNKKIPYSQNGVNLLRNAIVSVCDQFVKNGTLSDRPSTAEEYADTGTTTQPAYTISFTDIFDMTPAERAMRVGPPAKVVLNLTGAIHSLAINVEAYA